MKKLYVNELRPNGEVSTIGLFYSTEEAEGIVKKLQELPEKRSCKYEITETPPRSAAITPRREKQAQAEK
ncbi:MAG TPA: hypothetical protein DCZ05_00955 [Deltaproteobacteria bacterium]|nr:hypothetical protein [Deltaproteobacteria bacterium]